ncbi:MAG: septum formation initiator family protein [Chitinispirillaceae bacterium]|jgi:cell division protein FtsL
MKKRKIIIVIICVLLAGGGFFFLFGNQGIYYLFRQQRERAAEIRNNRRIIDSLQREIKKLTNDTAYIERMAREKLGMARQNESVYKFVEKRK